MTEREEVCAADIEACATLEATLAPARASDEVLACADAARLGEAVTLELVEDCAATCGDRAPPSGVDGFSVRTVMVLDPLDDAPLCGEVATREFVRVSDQALALTSGTAVGGDAGALTPVED